MARTEIRPPAGDPCPSCPYRQDGPVGVLDEAGYRKLAAYDLATFDQPQTVLVCLERPGQVCGGWAASHDGYGLLAIRMAGMVSGMTETAITRTLAYRTDVPVFTCGAEAAAHGLGSQPAG